MTPKSEEKLKAGFDALYSAVLYNRRTESETLFDDIANSFPEKKDKISNYYLYYLMKMSLFDWTEGILEDAKSNDKILFYNSYKDLHDNNIAECGKSLSEITAEFKYKTDCDSLFQLVSQQPVYNKKYKTISFLLSATLPGTGQLYAGSKFDAINNFSFNVITGIAAYSSWKYELTIDKDDRNYILPVISSLSFLGFYFTNLYNAVNITEKTNLYKESLYYKSILDRFNFIMSDQKYFLSYSVEF